MARVSVICPSFHELGSFGNQFMDPGQILLEATYPPILQTDFFPLQFLFIYFFFYDVFFFSFSFMGPYVSQNFKLLLLPQITPEFFHTSPNFYKVNFSNFYKKCSSAWLCQQSYCHGPGIHHLSIHLSSRKLPHGSRPNYMGSNWSTISPDCFSFFFFQNYTFQIFTIFFSFFINIGPYGS